MSITYKQYTNKKQSNINLSEALSVIRPGLIRITTEDQLTNFVEEKLNPKIELLESIIDDPSRKRLVAKFEDEINDMITVINNVDKDLLFKVYGITKM